MKYSKTIRHLVCKHITGHLYKEQSYLNHNQTGVYMINWCIVCKEYEIKVTSLKETFDSLYSYESSKSK